MKSASSRDGPSESRSPKRKRGKALVADLTERRTVLQRLQQEVERARAEVRDLYDDSPVAYVLLYGPGMIARINRVAAALLGDSVEALLNQPLEKFLAEEDRPKLSAHLARCSSCAEVTSIDVSLKTRPRAVRLLTVLTEGREKGNDLYKIVMEDLSETENLRRHLAKEIEIHKRREWLFSALNRINDVIHSGSTFDEIVTGALPEAVAALKCESAAISLRTDSHWEVRYIHGLDERTLGARMSDDEERHALLAIHSRQPVLIGDAYGDERLNQSHMKRWGIRAVIVIPLLEGERSVGVIFFNFHGGPLVFDDLYADFAQKLSASLSLALFKANMLTRLQQELGQRRKAEEELRESEERFRTMADSAPVMIWVHKADGELEWVNKAWEEFFGLKEKEAQGQGRWEVFVHPEDAEEYRRRFHESLTKRSKFDGEARVRHKSGEWRWVHSYGMPRFSITGDFLGMVGSSFDVTDQKQIEKASKREEENLRTMVEHSIEPMVVVNESGDIETVSNAALELLGYSKEEVIGRSVANVVEPVSRVELSLRLKDMHEHSPQATEATVRARKRDGTTEWILVEASIAARTGGAKKYLIKFQRLDYAP